VKTASKATKCAGHWSAAWLALVPRRCIRCWSRFES
jgi:hypothetical protein